MKYYALLLSTIIAPSSFAMEPLVEIRNRDLDTLQKPHITIINQLPANNPYFSSTRIDISDKTKIDAHDKYRPDESTKTIWPNQGIRFSLYKNRTLEPEHKRLGLNDAEDAALIALYIHGIPNNPLNHLVVGKGSFIPFGDTITITARPDGTTVFTNNTDMRWKTPITHDPEEKKLIPFLGVPSPGSIRFRDIDSRKLDNFRLILKDNYYFARHLLSQEFLRENPYIKKLVFNHEDDNENSLDDNKKGISLELLLTRGLLRSPETYSVLALLKHMADDFDQYLEENPDLKDAYPLDDDLDEQ